MSSFFGGDEARIKDVKWPATEPEAIHQDVSGFKTSTRSSFRELKKRDKSGTNKERNGKEPKR